MIVKGSLEFDSSGRKRKRISKTRSKKSFKEDTGRYEPAAMARIRADREKYKSANPKNAHRPIPKKDFDPTNHEFTIAPAYNKGAYQVIPNSGIKDIGK